MSTEKYKVPHVEYRKKVDKYFELTGSKGTSFRKVVAEHWELLRYGHNHNGPALC